jgi:hypothetical protein
MGKNQDISHYMFHSTQTHISAVNGKRTSTTEAVSIRNGKGMKTVVKTTNGKTRRAKHSLREDEIRNVMNRKFMPSLFVPCHNDCASPTSLVRKTKKATKKRSK